MLSVLVRHQLPIANPGQTVEAGRVRRAWLLARAAPDYPRREPRAPAPALRSEWLQSRREALQRVCVPRQRARGDDHAVRRGDGDEVFAFDG